MTIQRFLDLARVAAAIGLFLLLVGAATMAGARRDDATRLAVPAATAATQPVFGVNFISSAEDRAPGAGRNPDSLQRQYQNGLATGAGWNRWPLYWFNIETAPDVFDWSTQDATVQADMAYGLKLNAILLGTPPFYTTSRFAQSSLRPEPRPGQLSLLGAEKATPVGLYEPVFSDGTDTPGPGKSINPANKWARFTAAAVDRYRPGGVLAQANGWPAGVGVTHWEMWNEPDLNSFWDASVEDYARLLKVGYLAARQTDPNAVILFGGLFHFQKPSFYSDVLSIYAADPAAPAHNHYHDILAVHSYFHAWKSWYHVFRLRGVMADFNLPDRPVWLNETGVAGWDDYPGPVWDPKSALRATAAEQADYAIQSAAYALFAGADGYFHFQLYDGCGNQPQGTDFPPHNGELCDANGNYNGKPCAGDAHGLYSNPVDAACFRQHPTPETARPNKAAFQVVAAALAGAEPLWRQRVGDPCSCPDQLYPGDPKRRTPPQEWIAFYKPQTGQRVVALWTLCDRAETALVSPANPSGRGTLLFPNGATQPIAAQGGAYSIPLAPATNRNPFGSEGTNALFPIGGRPVLLVEDAPRLLTAASAADRTFLPMVIQPLSASCPAG
jgi:hypothetical protein